MSTPYDHFFWQLRELQKALDSVRPQLTGLEALPATVQEQIDQFRRIAETFTLPRDYLDAVHRIQAQLASSPAFEQLPQLAAHAGEFLQEFRAHQRQLELSADRISAVQELIRPPTEEIIESLVAVEALLSSVQMSESVLRAAFLPQRAFQDFLAFEFDRVADAASRVAKDSRLIFVDAAGELLDGMTTGFELGILMAPELASADLDVDWEVNVFASLAKKAEDAPFEDEKFDPEALVSDSCEAGIVRLGQQLIRLVYNLNTEAEREGKARIFKPTTKTLYACSLIPTQVAKEDESFYRIVDQLYFLLYEGSGDGKRITGTRSSTRFEALWRLKHLRRDGRHDVDHGGKREITRKLEETGKTFVSLIGAVVPRTSGDWCRAQLSLYEQLVTMLEGLWFNEEGESDDSEPPAGADG